MMRKVLSTLIILVFSAVGILGQEIKNSAPAKWEFYTDAKADFSVMLPKMPLRTEYNDECQGHRRLDYYAYAQDHAYKITIYQALKGTPPIYCVADC